MSAESRFNANVLMLRTSLRDRMSAFEIDEMENILKSMNQHNIITGIDYKVSKYIEILFEKVKQRPAPKYKKQDSLVDTFVRGR